MSLDQVLKTQAAMQAAAPQLQKLKQSCTDMEAAFMKTMVSTMRNSADQVHFGQQLGGDVYQDMFDEQLSEMLAQNEGSGLAMSMAAPMAAQVVNQTIASRSLAGTAGSEEGK
jgi:Rod binding domain-containing protein